MQTFLIKLLCFCLFGFLFYSAYKSHSQGQALTTKEKAILAINKIETKSFRVQSQQSALLITPLPISNGEK